MRKIITIGILLPLLTIQACSKKDAVNYSLTSDKTDIKYNETTQLKINVGNPSDYSWVSSDEFVGKVGSTGEFVAGHIGEATISAQKDGNQIASIKITVSPTENFYTEPHVEIGATKAVIKSKEKRTLANETSSLLAYDDPSSSLRGGVIYVFDAQGKLSGAIVPFTATTTNAGKVGRFYAERYVVLGSDESQFFYNDNKKRYSLLIDTDNDDFGFVAAYVKYTPTTSAKSRLKQIMLTAKKHYTEIIR